MNERQKRFADEYLIDLNAEAAAIRAGYSPRYARGNAHKLVANSGISKYIQKRIKDRKKRIEITQDMVICELANIAFANATDYAAVIEKQAHMEVDGKLIPMVDDEGKPVMYRTVEPVLTEALSEKQQKALAVIKKGRDGFEVKPYDKLRALELIGRHFGMWDKKTEKDDEEQTARIDKIKAETARLKGEDQNADMQEDGFIQALRGEVQNVWDE